MTWLEYRPDRVEAIAARLDLRDPNRRALHAVADRIAPGDGAEWVCDLATGVGKTYLAAGLVDYLAESGVRNVLIVVPLDAIYEKTIQNFTPGARKYIAGAEHQPVIVTAENFRQLGEALRDPRRLKLFIFKVQTLLTPSDDMRRRVHDVDESLGEALYAHLQALNDLVVIADEHHVYSGDAERYRSTIEELEPRGIVGLTATPNTADVRNGKVIFRYTLAEAIADGLVKIPVIVYRGDGIKDLHSQLADACHLRDVKEMAWRSYARSTGLQEIAPVVFVVCEKVERAQQVADTLSKEFLPGEGRVLLITGGSKDAALRALKAVEDSTSPVRAVVSVDKLKEGWDVRNIGVIVSFRPLISETLTEQVLGRGLRLPFGQRTGIEAVDTVDIVAHDSYRELLANKRALLEQFLDERASAAQELALTPSATAESAQPTLAFTFSSPSPMDPFIDDPTTILQIEEYDDALERGRAGAASAARFVSPAKGAPKIRFPRLERESVPRQFSLRLVTEQQARDLGARYLTDESVYLTRVALEAERGLGGEVALGTAFHEQEQAYLETLPTDEIRSRLEDRVLGLDVVQSTLDEVAAAQQVVGWFLAGAGVTEVGHAEWSVRRSELAARALETAIVRAHDLRASDPTWAFHVVDVPLVPPTRPMPSPVYDRWTPFVRGQWYVGWQHSVEEAASFDAGTTEWKLAELMEESSGQVAWWLRVYVNGPVWIEYEGGRYFPDFVAVDAAGVHWVVEGKADDDAKDADVLAKRAAAEAWTRRVNETGTYGEWRYLFATESAIQGANRRWQRLVEIAG